LKYDPIISGAGQGVRSLTEREGVSLRSSTVASTEIDCGSVTKRAAHQAVAHFIVMSGPGRVEERRGCLGHAATLRFLSPLIEPDMQISSIRLSDKTSRLRPRLVVAKPAQTYESEVPV